MENNGNYKAWYVFAFSVIFLIAAFSFLNKGFSGAAEFDTGEVNFTINSSLSIIFTDELVSFGQGAPNDSFALVDSESSVANGSWAPVYDIMVVENDGNTLANVSIYASKDSDEFIGGIGSAFRFRSTNNETNSCISGITSTYTDVPDAEPYAVVCQRFNYSDTADTLNLHYQITVPQAAPPGDKTNQVTVRATSTV